MTRKLKEFVNYEPEVAESPAGQEPHHVAILLAHYNSGAFLNDQLQSLLRQTHQAWSLILSDDGSRGDWIKTVGTFAKRLPRRQVTVVNGPGLGFAQNFMSLIKIAGPTVPFAAFCDQDDVWQPGKLTRALDVLAKVEPGRPALYCGRTSVCDRDLRPIAVSPRFRKPPSFANALVQNVGGGNTMVVNRAALDLLQDTARHAHGIVSHDWWAYQLISGAGGIVIYDPEPYVLYRQHGTNALGANLSWTAKLLRLRQLLRGQYCDWNTANATALERVKHWLVPEAREKLEMFAKARKGRLFSRLCALRDSGLHRQTLRGQIALWLAVLLRRL